jgi:hypothetical protein
MVRRMFEGPAYSIKQAIEEGIASSLGARGGLNRYRVARKLVLIIANSTTALPTPDAHYDIRNENKLTCAQPFHHWADH